MKAHRRVLAILAMALAVALACFIVPAVTDSGGQASAKQPLQLIYYDGHMHTTRSDGNGSVADIVATAQARGLSAVIITDHCKQLDKDEWKSLVRETKAASDDSFLALPGVEVTGSEGMLNRGHVNAYNVDEPFVEAELCPEEVWLDPPNPYGTGANAESLAKWVKYIQSQGGIANHNHTTGHTLLDYGVNNVEIYNQGHVDDIMGYALMLGLPPQQAWEFAITINNFAIYGERDLMMPVEFPGIPFPIPLRLALFLATEAFSGTGQVVGWSDPPDPSIAGDLNSWDELLMAYVDGTVKSPIFGVANSDAHNTGDPESIVGTAKNGLYVKKLSADEVYKAIAEGRSFATTGPSLAFDVNDELMGDTAEISDGTATLNLSVNSESATAILVKIDIIRNGEVWQTIYPSYPDPVSTYEVTLDDEDVSEDGYYRVEVTSYDVVSEAYYFAWSNPVFVDIK